MLALRRAEIRDKYSGEVIGEVAIDTRRDLRAKIHKAFLAKESKATAASMRPSGAKATTETA